LQAYGAKRVLGGLRLTDSMTSALDGGSLSDIRSGRLYQQEYPGTQFKLQSRPRTHANVGYHGKKFQVTPPRIEHTRVPILMNEWRYTSTPLIPLLGTDRVNFTFTLLILVVSVWTTRIKILTPEINPSTKRWLMRFLLGILLLERCILLMYTWKTNKCNNYSFSLLIMYGISYMFRHYIAILRGALWRDAHAHHVTWHNTPIHNILSTAPHLSIYQKALGTFPEDGNLMPKHAEDTIHN
jgi:TRAP-type mannitol/chloroaromatic compound transport system permease small subunit